MGKVRRFNKRGQEDKLYFLIWEMIALAAVILVILIAVRGVVNGSSYWKKYYSSDLALMSDLANTNRGDFTINYALKSQGDNYWSKIYLISNKMFEISMESDAVKVYDAPKEDSKSFYTFPFAKNKDVVVQENSVISDFIVLSKSGSIMSIGEYGLSKSSDCNSMQPMDTRADMALININSFSTDAKTNLFSDSISAILKNHNINNEMANGSDIIMAYSKDASFTIYYSLDQKNLLSKKLACLVAREYSLDPRFASNAVDIKPYDGFLDNNKAYADYMSREFGDKEFWIVILLSDNELVKRNIDRNQFAQVVKNAVVKYYG